MRSGSLANAAGAFGGAGRPTKDGRPPVADEAGSGAGRTPPVFFSFFFHMPSVGKFYQLRDGFFIFFSVGDNIFLLN